MSVLLFSTTICRIYKYNYNAFCFVCNSLYISHTHTHVSVLHVYKYFILIQVICEVMLSDLVEITSEPENTFIVNELSKLVHYRINGMFIFTKSIKI